MRRILSTLTFALALVGSAGAAEIQGVIADWNCVEGMVHDGRQKALHDHRDCSLVRHYKRDAYGLITQDKKFYKLDDAGSNQHIIELLGNSHDKDNLKVLVRGDLQGNTIKVANISIL